MKFMRAVATVRTASAGYLHGLVLRGLALVAKFVFLIVVVPGLPDGTYAAYLYLFTIGLITARFLSLGAEEHIPTLVRDNRGAADAFVPMFAAGFVLAAASLLLFLLVGSVWVLVAALVAQLAAGWVLGGLTRAHAPHHYERLLNGPVLVFVATCLIAPPQTLAALLVYYIAANMLFQLATALMTGALARADFVNARRALPDLLRTMVPGLAKTVSNVLVVLNTRAAVVLPVVLGAAAVSDEIALALSIGEAVWQLGMVVAMRNYAAYCRSERAPQQMLLSGLALFAALATLGLVALVLPIPFVAAKLDWKLVGWSLVLVGALLVFMEARYFAWAEKGATTLSSTPFVAFQVAFLAVQAAIVLVAPVPLWLPTMAVAAAMFALLFLAVVFFRMAPPPTPGD